MGGTGGKTKGASGERERRRQAELLSGLFCTAVGVVSLRLGLAAPGSKDGIEGPSHDRRSHDRRSQLHQQQSMQLFRSSLGFPRRQSVRELFLLAKCRKPLSLPHPSAHTNQLVIRRSPSSSASPISCCEKASLCDCGTRLHGGGNDQRETKSFALFVKPSGSIAASRCIFHRNGTGLGRRDARIHLRRIIVTTSRGSPMPQKPRWQSRIAATRPRTPPPANRCAHAAVSGLGGFSRPIQLSSSDSRGQSES